MRKIKTQEQNIIVNEGSGKKEVQIFPGQLMTAKPSVTSSPLT
jgi:hypothetical protein